MSKRDGRVYAAFGIVILVLLGAAPLPNSPPVENAQGAIPNGEQPESRQKQSPPPPSAKNSPSQPEPNSAPANPGARENDVESPVWTDKVVAITAILVAVFTAVLTWVGIEQALLLRRSVRESASALDIARKSADAAAAGARATRRLVGATTANAQAAHAAVRISEFANDAMLRPYVYLVDEAFYPRAVFGQIEHVGMSVADFAPVRFSLKNFGQTPAKNVRLTARAYIGPHREDLGPLDLSAEHAIYRGDIPPGHAFEIDAYTIGGLANDFKAIGNQEKTVVLEGLIEYEDGNRSEHQTEFRRLSCGDDVQRGKFFVAPDYNRAT
ncbi:hypothetical protein [Phenylobacterium sp.]|uniref:hypothetical protein n=1 Tax=Phenylobacterium sp. TaxID=1871053 RepID=UPI0019837B45|nr:hypothetical protein [Phenylobacterium sp.]MBC7168929.1 hypothetical protein [Phenylobacterium sp.]